MAEKGLSEPFRPGKKPSRASKKDIEEVTNRVNTLSEGMKQLYEDQQGRINELTKSVETLVKTLSAMRGAGAGAQPQTGQSQLSPRGQQLAEGLMSKILLGGSNQPSTLESLVALMFRESIMMQRTLRLGLMKRLHIEELFPEEKESDSGSEPK